MEKSTSSIASNSLEKYFICSVQLIVSRLCFYDKFCCDLMANFLLNKLFVNFYSLEEIKSNRTLQNRFIIPKHGLLLTCRARITVRNKEFASFPGKPLTLPSSKHLYFNYGKLFWSIVGDQKWDKNKGREGRVLSSGYTLH